MNTRSAAEILLGFAVVLAWLCSAGILKTRNAYERLHYLTPIATLSSIAVIVAILLNEPFSQAGGKLILIALLLLATNAVLAHATARAAGLREPERPSMPDARKPPKTPPGEK